MELKFEQDALPRGLTFEVVDGKVVSMLMDTDEPDVQGFLRAITHHVDLTKKASLLK